MKSVSLCVIIMLCICTLTVSANECPGCERGAVMGKCENKAMPEDFKERNKEYWDCLSEQLDIARDARDKNRDPTMFYPDDIDKLRDNVLEKCKYLKPDFGREFSPVTDEVMFSDLRTLLSVVLHCDRFHIMNKAIMDAHGTSAEYFFEATYDCALVPNIDTTWNNRELYPSSLNIRMYYDGEQKELVKEWTVNSPVHSWYSLKRRMFINPGSDWHEPALMRKEVPITNLLDAFEKKPDQCRVKPEKEEVKEGEEIDIVLSDFRDASQQPSREFNRILVHADEGKIFNGSKCVAGPDYRVFRLDEQPITVHYRAPKSGEANSDRITVYNACEILPLEKSPLRATSPHKEIATCDLRLKHYAWKGSLHLEVIRRFQCNEQEQTSELSRREVRANDEKTQKVNLTISMDDFDLAMQPAIAATHLIVNASGEMNCVYNEDHFTAVRSVKTWCLSPKRWESPGGWSTKHETWTGEAFRHIKKENINLLIAKDMELNKAAMQDLQQQMQEAAQNKDMAAIQKLKGQIVGMIKGDQDSNTIPIRVRVEIMVNIAEKDPIMTTYERKVYNVCLGRYEVDESGTNTIELPIAHPMAAELKGTYVRGKDGRDTIMATVNMTETSQGMFCTDICPEVTTTISGQINLERLRK